ncbi:PREDICTED: stigma-specific STIG1-like protein 1 [Tarenaya hassleriana]|uniref:stigma-specific STIG1-like protein 1 n=1 Tax=Tarenaya hassleriana TaxID=28532 RepID=UPI00053C9D1D|nr:PREDICTED: stigma-specific STIG1-like protein 1 [Tarenaya hassleriana]
MALIKFLVAIAVTTAIAIAIITTMTTTAVDRHVKNDVQETKIRLNPEPKPSRFLAQVEKPRNPNAADHCHKNPEICSNYGGNATACCNNKCVDLSYDDKNCGSCQNKCKFSQTCCRGQCVYLAYDKRHCGQCNHRCPVGEFCVYGLCNYA